MGRKESPPPAPDDPRYRRTCTRCGPKPNIDTGGEFVSPLGERGNAFAGHPN
jgi:hypothetical protein